MYIVSIHKYIKTEIASKVFFFAIKKKREKENSQELENLKMGSGPNSAISN